MLGTIEYDALLARTNGALISELISLLANSKRVHVVGGVDDILRLLDGVKYLQGNTPTDVPEFFGFSNWNEVLTAAKADELPDMTTFVNLVEKYGVRNLIAAVKSTESSAATAHVEVSTVHKAKGREWNRVRLTDDFLIAQDKKTDGQKKLVGREEIRIAYVAVTRAKEAVYVPPGIRAAFSIAQDSHFDAVHQSQAAMPSHFPPPRTPSKNAAPHSQASRAIPSTKPSKANWLDHIRSWFR
jgi:superfamily I DNA/RNA helicase